MGSEGGRKGALHLRGAGRQQAPQRSLSGRKAPVQGILILKRPPADAPNVSLTEHCHQSEVGKAAECTEPPKAWESTRGPEGARGQDEEEAELSW